MLVAFIWTFFPYPLTARSKLRHDLGASLYLLANFYSCVHTTVGMRLNGSEGDLKDKSSPGYRLNKARTTVFSQELALLNGLREHSRYGLFLYLSFLRNDPQHIPRSFSDESSSRILDRDLGRLTMR